MLPKWSLAGEGVHICTTDAGSFFASLSDEHHIWIGGPQIEKTENSSTAAAGRRQQPASSSFHRPDRLHGVPLCNDGDDVLPAGLCRNRCLDEGQGDHADVYTQILAISTIAAIVTASVALLLMNFSRSGRTVDESRAWLKRICITWAVLNGLGFIMAYVTPLFSGGQWTG